MFATFDNHHHGAPHVGVWLAMPLGAQEALVYQDPKRFFVPPYVGTRGWVGVRLDNRPSWTTVEKVVRESYAHIAQPSRARTRPPSGTAAPRGPRR
jgi:predicted DNA-binding protein (MmcQ/YjbR family)